LAQVYFHVRIARQPFFEKGARLLANYARLIPLASLVLILATTAVPGHADEGKTIFGANQQETLKAMKALAQSLGVKCQDCHLKQGGKLDYKAETEHKKVTRQMKQVLVDSLVEKGSGEIAVVDGHHQTKITARYVAQGDAPGIHLTMLKGEKSYQKTQALPAAGQTITCMICHNGQLHFLAPEPEHNH
jgi:hypothetical protein